MDIQLAHIGLYASRDVWHLSLVLFIFLYTVILIFLSFVRLPQGKNYHMTIAPSYYPARDALVIVRLQTVEAGYIESFYVLFSLSICIHCLGEQNITPFTVENS